MITIATNNCAVSPAIHSLGRCLCPESAQTAYAAQLTRKLRSFHAKQTQFQKSQNQPNHLCEKGLWKYVPSWATAKQTQFQNHRPRTDPASTNMQNKPNLRKAKMNLTCYEHKDYRNLRLPGLRQNKPNLLNAQNKRKCSYNKGIWKCATLPTPPKQTQSNPIKPNKTQTNPFPPLRK